MTKVSSPKGDADGRLLTGHVGVWNELLETLGDRRGLTVISADPWSGSSSLLHGVLESLASGSDETGAALTSIEVDARGCTDAFDLAMAVADATVERLAPSSLNWWLGSAPPSSTRGFALYRTLDAAGVDAATLRYGDPRIPDRLSHAMAMVAAVADGPCTVVVDHLGRMLAGLRRREAREILSLLRTARQAHPTLDLVLLDHPGGVILQALRDRDHPLYRAGEIMRIRRPTPEMFTHDLMITRPLVVEPVDLVRAAAELSAGASALLWRIVDLAPASGDGVARAGAGWSRLVETTEPWLAHQWDLLRRVHPTAQALVAALGRGVPPNRVPAASKSIGDGLARLRALGVTWQPEPRRWVLTDPLLGAFARRQYAPPWVHRTSSTRGRHTP